MRKLHLAISTDRIEAAVADFSRRLGATPCSYVAGQYALWRTDALNVSLRQDAEQTPGSLRHLGWEDPSAPEFTQESDIHGVLWEHFNAQHQAEEINALWPEAHYTP
ncbi:hypothetical protein [Algiphilus sp.]|nr:hypothetical protein [Algiphilus acroporae]MCI5063632.1 hypothetical protein [Algiphilus sp.]